MNKEQHDGISNSDTLEPCKRTHDLVSSADGEGHASSLKVLVLGVKDDVGGGVIAWERSWEEQVSN